MKKKPQYLTSFPGLLKNKEQALSYALTQLIPDLLFVLDSKNVFIDVQVPDKPLPDIPHKKEDYIGKTLADIFPPQIEVRIADKIKETREKQALIKFNLSIKVTSDYHYFELGLIPFQKDKIIALVSDVSNIKKLNEELLLAKEQAFETNTKINSFLASISKELRTPMNSIIGFTALLERENISLDKKQQYISHIKNNGQALIDLIDDIITVTKIESNKLSIIKTDFDLNNLLKDLLYRYKFEVEALNKSSRLSIECLPLPDSQEIIYSDIGRIEQVLISLLNNAIKFTNKGSIVFGCEIVPKEEHYKFFVKDTGEGISDDLREHLFTRFSDPQENDLIYNRTGLGLRISKGIVNLLGGDIWFESRTDNGTNFYFTIPFEKDIKDQIQPRNKGIKKWKNKKILIVEDEEVNYLLLSEMLSETEALIYQAKTGQEFINKCKHIGEYDLILMDIKLPDNNGIELTKYAKSLRKDIPIIAQTAYGFDKDKLFFTDAGFDDVIFKPIDFYMLLDLIEKYI